MQEVQSCRKVSCTGFQVSDESQPEGIVLNDILQPEDVHHPRTAFNGDCTDDLVWQGQRLVSSRQGRLGQYRRGLFAAPEPACPRGDKNGYMRVANWNRLVESLKEGGVGGNQAKG